VGLGAVVALCLLVEWGRLLIKCSFPLLGKMSYGVLGTLYLGIAILWFLSNLGLPDGWRLSFWILFLVWSTDTGAYFGGKLLKGPKLAPSLSPNKTWSGFFSGLISGTTVGYFASLWLLPGVFPLGAIVVLVIISHLGDLLESQAKRWSHVKDSGALIPGHGGFLDRLDSFLAVCFTLALWQVLF
jgi:phosphatidate cytidylyltransferase